MTKLAGLIAGLLVTATLVTVSPVQAAVPGLDFTETGCEGDSDSVARLYTAGLGRTPEADGFDFWMVKYTTGEWNLKAMATFFTQSPEFAATYGSLDQDGFIRQIYRNVLGREGEQDGVTFWNEQMSAGMTRGTLLLRFSESPENIATSGTSQPALGEFNEGRVGPWTCPGWAPSGGDETAGLRLSSTSLGEILVDGDGNTLYLFVPDRQGESTCYDSCEVAWPVVGEVSGVGEGLDPGLLGTTIRTNGDIQATYNDWPLYYYVDDAAPGDTTGQGAGNIWYVLDAAGNAIGLS